MEDVEETRGRRGWEERREIKKTSICFHDASVLHLGGGVTGGKGRERTVGRIER